MVVCSPIGCCARGRVASRPAMALRAVRPELERDTARHPGTEGAEPCWTNSKCSALSIPHGALHATGCNRRIVVQCAKLCRCHQTPFTLNCTAARTVKARKGPTGGSRKDLHHPHRTSLVHCTPRPPNTAWVDAECCKRVARRM